MTQPTPEELARETIEFQLHGVGNGFPEATMYEAGWERLCERFAQTLHSYGESCRKEAPTVFYNNSNDPIIIVSGFSANPLGGRGVSKTEYMVLPGQGIDISIVGLDRALKE